MVTNIFVNLPVKDLKRSMDFFRKLGFTFNPQFTDDNAACLILGDNIYAMLLVEKFFATFTAKEIADAAKTAEAIVALSVDSREKVDEMVRIALASGGKPYNPLGENGPMYGGSFQDPDDHLWEVFYMDPSTVNPV